MFSIISIAITNVHFCIFVSFQRVQLNRLSQKEVDDAKMASVFGKEEDENDARRNSMRVNPLYDQDGSVTVSSTEAQRARSSSTTSDGAEETDRKSNKPFKKSKRRSVPDDESESNVPEPKIAYSKNFRFKGPKQNGTANGHAGQKKIVSYTIYIMLHVCMIKFSIFVRKSHEKNVKKY